MTQEEQDRCRTAYWALVDRLDALIGQVLRALEESGLADNTLIVYTTDHGEQAGEHGLWWKQTFYEHSARVPLLISWPGKIAAEQCRRRVVSALDVTATLLDVARAPPLPDMVGRSLSRPQLFNPEDDPDEMHDLAEDPRYTEVPTTLTARVLEEWDAEAIAREQALKREQLHILRAWARATRPQEQYRWPITREMHWLDEEGPLSAS